MEGLEPPRLSAPDPKSGAATNYATCAQSFARPAKVGDLQLMAKSTFDLCKFVRYGICCSDAQIQFE